MNFSTYDAYVDLFSEWQAKLLDIADQILVTSNVYTRIRIRKRLASTFVAFLKEVDTIELRITHTMSPSIHNLQTPSLQMGDDATRHNGIFDDAEEDTSTVNANNDDTEDFDYDEQGSVDMMFEDLNTIRDEYQDFLKLVAEDDEGFDDEEHEALLDDIARELASNFAAVREAIIQRLGWSERTANEAIGWIDRPRTRTYLQNTGRDESVVVTNVEATMLTSRNYNYGIMVPARVYNTDGTFTDYNVNGEAV